MESRQIIPFLVICMAVAGIIFGLPHLLIPLKLGPDQYWPFGQSDGAGSMITEEEVYTYVSAVQEILEGKLSVHDAQLAEKKHLPSPYIAETLPAYLVAGIALGTMSTANAFVVSDFLFPALIVSLLYYACRKLEFSQGASLVISITTIASENLMELVPYPKPLWDLLIHLKGVDDFLIFSRSFHPQVSFFIFLSGILLLDRALEKRTRRLMVCAGLVAGLQFYTYVFYWTDFFFLLLLLACWFVATKKWKQLFTLLPIVAISLGIGSIYLSSAFAFHESAESRDFWLSSATPDRLKLYISIRYLLISIAALLFSRGRSLLFTLLALAVFSASVLPQLSFAFTGRDLESMHWIRRVAIPTSVVLVAFLLKACGEKLPSIIGRQTSVQLVRVTTVIAGIVVIQFAVRVQVSASNRFFQFYRQNTAKDELFRWMNQTTPVDASIATLDPVLQTEIPAFTHANNVIPIRIRSVVTVKEAVDRFLHVAAFYHVDPGDLERLLTEIYASRLFFFQANYGGQYFSLSPDQYREISTEYDRILSEENRDMYPSYRIDYVIVGPFERSIQIDMTLDSDSEKKLVFQNSRYNVYSSFLF